MTFLSTLWRRRNPGAKRTRLTRCICSPLTAPAILTQKFTLLKLKLEENEIRIKTFNFKAVFVLSAKFLQPQSAGSLLTCRQTDWKFFQEENRLVAERSGKYFSEFHTTPQLAFSYQNWMYKSGYGFICPPCAWFIFSP